jgi:hypothetical protein
LYDGHVPLKIEIVEILKPGIFETFPAGYLYYHIQLALAQCMESNINDYEESLPKTSEFAVQRIVAWIVDEV